jgi:4-amino-4-deoxy-L-arabinose transferase-like glycosyltransferase
MTSHTKSWFTDLLVLTLIIGIFYSLFLGTRPLMVPDEGRYAEIAREMALTDDYITPHLNGIKYLEKPPLFYWMETLAVKTMGLSEGSLRLAPMIFGILGCLVTYIAARKLYGRRSALLATCILASSGLYYIVSHMVILDILLTVFLSCCLFCFILGVREPPGRSRDGYLWGMYIFAALAMLSKGLVAVLLPGMIIFAWILVFKEWRQLKSYRLITGSLIFLSIVLPWHWMIQLQNPEFFHYYFIDEHFERYLTHYANHEEPIWFFTVCIILGFFPWVAFLVQSFMFNLPKKWQDYSQYKESIFLILWAALIFLFFSFSHSKLISYIAPIFPALAILMGHYFSHLWTSRERQKSLVAGFVIILTMGLAFSLGGLATIETHLLSLKIMEDINYLYLSFILLILMTLISVWLYAFSHVRIAFISLSVFTVFFLVSLNLSYSVLNSRSAKSLALTAKPLLGEGDQLIIFHTYCQDVPVYVDNIVTVVDWKGELDFGRQHQKDSSNWMIFDKEFYRLWGNPKKQRYMVMDQNEYHVLRGRNVPLYLLAETPRYVLVTNMSSRE